MSSKSEILKLLNQNPDAYLSGEMLAKQLQISRNSVWKAINALRSSGYEIEAVTNRGYRLLTPRDELSEEQIRSLLPEDIHLPKLYIKESVVSTSLLAKEMAMKDAGHGTVIIADRQSGGTAHHASSFFSPSGGLYLSVILKPRGRINPTVFTEGVAGEICKHLSRLTGEGIRIRNINDLFLNGKKCGGILTESVTDFESGEYQWIVVGVGINVSLPHEEFPEELREKAVSLFPGEKDRVSRNELSAAIIRSVLKPEHTLPEEIHRQYLYYHD